MNFTKAYITLLVTPCCFLGVYGFVPPTLSFHNQRAELCRVSGTRRISDPYPEHDDEIRKNTSHHPSQHRDENFPWDSFKEGFYSTFDSVFQNNVDKPQHRRHPHPHPPPARGIQPKDDFFDKLNHADFTWDSFKDNFYSTFDALVPKTKPTSRNKSTSTWNHSSSSTRAINPRSSSTRAINPRSSGTRAINPRSSATRAINPRSSSPTPINPRPSSTRAINPKSSSTKPIDPWEKFSRPRSGTQPIPSSSSSTRPVRPNSSSTRPIGSSSTRPIHSDKDITGKYRRVPDPDLLTRQYEAMQQELEVKTNLFPDSYKKENDDVDDDLGYMEVPKSLEDVQSSLLLARKTMQIHAEDMKSIPYTVKQSIQDTQHTVNQKTQETVDGIMETNENINFNIRNAKENVERTIDAVRDAPFVIKSSIEDTKYSVQDQIRMSRDTLDEMQGFPYKAKTALEDTVEDVKDISRKIRVLVGFKKGRPLLPHVPTPPKKENRAVTIALGATVEIAKGIGKGAHFLGTHAISGIQHALEQIEVGEFEGSDYEYEYDEGNEEGDEFEDKFEDVHNDWGKNPNDYFY